MPGSAGLPGGEPRKASQRNPRRGKAPPTEIARLWRWGEAVRWQDRTGVYRRDVGDGEHAEVLIGERVYRVRIDELS